MPRRVSEFQMWSQLEITCCLHLQKHVAIRAQTLVPSRLRFDAAWIRATRGYVNTYIHVDDGSFWASNLFAAPIEHGMTCGLIVFERAPHSHSNTTNSDVLPSLLFCINLFCGNVIATRVWRNAFFFVVSCSLLIHDAAAHVGNINAGHVRCEFRLLRVPAFMLEVCSAYVAQYPGLDYT